MRARGGRWAAAALLVLALIAACGGPAAQPTPAPAPTSTVAAKTAPPAQASPKPASPAPASPAPASSPAAPSPSAAAKPTVATAAFDSARTRVDLQPAWSGFAKPLGVVSPGDGSGRLFVIEQTGRIRVVDGGQVRPQPFLDVAGQITSQGSEQGLLGLAFHPRYRENGLFFVNYTDRQGDTQVVRYRVSADPNVADAASARTILSQDQPFPNHNGGHLTFGPDGMLWIGLGDGGSANDPQGNGQKLSTWLGKMLRIDVDNGDPYTVPRDNPFVGQQGALPEIWAYGLRNPWRYSFDRQTGDLWVADVGQNAYEEINVVPAGTPGGVNFGWNRMEGAHCRGQASCDQSGLLLPVAEYGRDGGCSVTGGFVYRGQAQPALTGAYFYGDYCSGRIWALVRTAAGAWQPTEVFRGSVQVSSFGQDEAGELYVTGLGDGRVYRLVAR